MDKQATRLAEGETGGLQWVTTYFSRASIASMIRGRSSAARMTASTEPT